MKEEMKKTCGNCFWKHSFPFGRNERTKKAEYFCEIPKSKKRGKRVVVTTDMQGCIDWKRLKIYLVGEQDDK